MWTRIEILTLLFILALIALIFAVHAATAHDYKHPELKEWYQHLRSGKGPCCDDGEATHLSPDQWERQNKPFSHFRVYLNNEWIDVEDSAVLNEPNKDPEQRALVWPYASVMSRPAIRCFMPGIMG